MARLDGWNCHTHPVDTEMILSDGYWHAHVGITSLGFTTIVVISSDAPILKLWEREKKGTYKINTEHIKKTW